ncbi:MAG: TonB-dependent receptor, partial [Acidobacteriota bacterium]
EDARRSDPDLLITFGRTTEATGEIGAGLSVRGQAPDQITVVVDGVELVEPYHLRNLGKLASTVTPAAVDRVELHRGRPPLAFGASSGGVLEMLTEAPDGRFSGRVGATSGERSSSLESGQATLHGTAAGGRLRGIAAHRVGEPAMPQEINEFDQEPEFDDTLIKLSGAVTDRWDVNVQYVGADDSFDFRRNDLLGASEQILSVGQSGRHYGLRSLLTIGSRHLLEVVIADVDVERWRWAFEANSELLSLGGDSTIGVYLINDRRTTDRQVNRLLGRSSIDPRFDLVWGGERGRERTFYDYIGFNFGAAAGATIDDELELSESYASGFGQATWRPAENVTADIGLRVDQGDLADRTSWAPRASVAYRTGRGVWRAAYARTATRAPTDTLPISDGIFQNFRPKPETSHHYALGYVHQTSGSLFSAELYSQRIDDPLLRSINLYKPVSRIPELEFDRRLIDAERSRLEGLELRYEIRRRRLQAGLEYRLSRSEDLIREEIATLVLRDSEGAAQWFPRREDRRHRLHLWGRLDLRRGFGVSALFTASSGAPTTPFDTTSSGLFGFGPAIGELNSERLDSEHRLDLRLLYTRRFGERLTANFEIGVDDVYDNPRVRGFSFASFFIDNSAQPELDQGRRVRWAVEFSW